jgi:hypothetical protein
MFRRVIHYEYEFNEIIWVFALSILVTLKHLCFRISQSVSGIQKLFQFNKDIDSGKIHWALILYTIINFFAVNIRKDFSIKSISYTSFNDFWVLVINTL